MPVDAILKTLRYLAPSAMRKPQAGGDNQQGAIILFEADDQQEGANGEEDQGDESH